jgi:hypothetical protein
MLCADHLVLRLCCTHHRPDIIHGITLPTIPYFDGACQRVGLTARNTEQFIKLLHLVHFEGDIVSDADDNYSTTAAAAAAGGSKKGHKRPVPKVEDNSDYIYPADAYGDKYTELAAAAANGGAGGGSSSANANANANSRKRVHVRTLNDLVQSTDDENGWLDSDGEPYVRKKRIAQSALNKVSARQKAAAAAAAASNGATNGASSSKGKGKGNAKARPLPPTATAAAATPKKSNGSSSNGSSTGGAAKVKVEAEPRSAKGKGKSTPTVLPWLYESEVAQQDMVHKCIWIKWNADINAW